ncbi:MAG: V-type ATP synthase subunit I, partial [Halobacteria archaeon]|nr:V-type ATP synthase subunit I [Halobacteria archaeon]
MLRPERMSKVSVAGSKSVMDDVIETLHDLNLVHVSDYDGSWEGFENGESLEGADEGSERLVQIRSIENILEVDEGDADTRISLDDDELETRLEELR